MDKMVYLTCGTEEDSADFEADPNRQRRHDHCLSSSEHGEDHEL